MKIVYVLIIGAVVLSLTACTFIDVPLVPGI